LIRSEILQSLIPEVRKLPAQAWPNFVNNFYVASVWIIIFAYEKLYTKRYTFWDEIKVLLKSSSISFSFILIAIFITKSHQQFSRPIVLLAWLMSLVLFPIFRYFIKLLLVQTNLWKKKLIILGVHQTSLMVLRSIEKNKTMGYEVLGFLDDDPSKIGKKFQGVKVLGPLSELENITKTLKSKDIMIATPHLPRKNLRELLSTCDNISDSMWLIPRTGDFITEGVEIEVLGEVLTLSIKKNLAKPWNILIKSIYEKCLTFIALIILSPLFVLIAIAIKLDSKGPIFYTQKRLGQNKRMFNIIKFRSMHLDIDEKLYEYLETNPEAKKEWEKFKKLKDYDPRVTKTGLVIRKFSLDELPQLFNVLQGKMSLVGPRPYLLDELEGKDSFIGMISRVKPGITGLWQISGRSEVPFEQRNAFDEYYVRNWSLWLDIKILLKSLRVLFSSKGAY
jgi:undecaprenyl-phosphate galactose phosphotransferase